MKLPSTQPRIGIFNIFSLISVSLVWGHMLNLISPWFIPLTVFMTLIGFGSEIKQTPGSSNDKITF